MAESNATDLSANILYQQEDLRGWRMDCGTFDFDTEPAYQGLDRGEFDPEAPKTASPLHIELVGRRRLRSPMQTPMVATLPVFQSLLPPNRSQESPAPRRLQGRGLSMRRPLEENNPSWAVITGAVKPTNAARGRPMCSAQRRGPAILPASHPASAAPAPLPVPTPTALLGQAYTHSTAPEQVAAATALPGATPTPKGVAPSPAEYHGAAPMSVGHAQRGGIHMPGGHISRESHPDQRAGSLVCGNDQPPGSYPQAQLQVSRFVAEKRLPSVPRSSTQTDDTPPQGSVSHQGRGSGDTSAMRRAEYGIGQHDLRVVGQQGGFAQATDQRGSSTMVVDSQTLIRNMQPRPSQSMANVTRQIRSSTDRRIVQQLSPPRTFEEFPGQTTPHRGPVPTQYGSQQGIPVPSQHGERRITNVLGSCKDAALAQRAPPFAAQRSNGPSTTAQQFASQLPQWTALPHQTDHLSSVLSQQLAYQPALEACAPYQNGNAPPGPTEQVTGHPMQQVSGQAMQRAAGQSKQHMPGQPMHYAANRSTQGHFALSENFEDPFMRPERITGQPTPNWVVPQQTSNVPSTPTKQEFGRKRKVEANPTPPESPALEGKRSRPSP